VTNPLATALVIAAHGAAAKLLERGVDAGVEWIRTYLNKYGSETQARAEANQRNFLMELARRVQQMEEEMLARGEDGANLEGRLGDPDFSATLQDALIASGRTESGDKHRVLARVVAADLGATPESTEAVVCGSAVLIVPRLTHNQLNVLGLLTFMHRVTPAPGWPEPYLTEDEVLRTLHEHWTWALSPYLSATETRSEELTCLAAYGCIFYVPQRYSDIRSVMKRGIAAVPERAKFIEEFLATDQGRALERLWAAGLRSAYPQQLGVLIGGAIHSLRNGEQAEVEQPAAR
jgi:hypothetical protein